MRQSNSLHAFTVVIAIIFGIGLGAGSMWAYDSWTEPATPAPQVVVAIPDPEPEVAQETKESKQPILHPEPGETRPKPVPQKPLPPALQLQPLSGLLQLPPPTPTDSPSLRIGFVTDPHAGSKATSPGRGALIPAIQKRITHITEQMNNVLKPDFILVNGDVIEGTKVPNVQGREELRQTRALFDQTSIPKVWVLGNHDLRAMTKAQWQETLGVDTARQAFIAKGYKIITIDSNYTKSGADVSPLESYTRGNVAQAEVDWLKQELATPEQKIVFLHHPPLRDIPGESNIGLLDNARELQKLFAQNNVIAVFAGHTEDLYSGQYQGVHYFVLPGMTKDPEYPGNFALLEFHGPRVSARMSYIDQSGQYTTVDIESEVERRRTLPLQTHIPEAD